MNPQPLFCPNPDCPASGQLNRGHIHLHSRKDKRYRCSVYGHTFRLSQGTLYRGLRTAKETVTLVVTLMAYGSAEQVAE